ncbi:hypothetical protein GC105_11550 [Alkalibaculum sp. M08DMB]|uniref:Uncharacterized protein n=1 Tax=Alkalibaculum sporogenes TaxID=2655001 RepID=A0A6A7KAE8_9FIRM|nr:hypothetical protein [Alkalibaculum sporogenes]MPW26424.1 hypothetical protein [Alkalibaculum sporogenes]
MKQAYDVERKRIINIVAMTRQGAISQYSLPNKPNQIFFPLIGEDGKNIEQFNIIGKVKSTEKHEECF